MKLDAGNGRSSRDPIVHIKHHCSGSDVSRVVAVHQNLDRSRTLRVKADVGRDDLGRGYLWSERPGRSQQRGAHETGALNCGVNVDVVVFRYVQKTGHRSDTGETLCIRVGIVHYFGDVTAAGRYADGASAGNTG